MTFLAGQIPTALELNTDINGPFTLGFGAFSTYVPTWTQSATVTKTVNFAKYWRVGRLVTVQVSMTATGAGTAANAMVVSLPITGTADVGACGSFWFNDAGTAFYSGTTRKVSSTTLLFYIGGSSSGGLGATGGGFVSAIAATDQLEFVATYEAAS